MKSAWVFCFAAMFFCAVEAATTELKLSRLHPRLLTLFYSSDVMIFPIIMIVFFTDKKELSMPQGGEWVFMILMIAASFVAALAHFAGILSEEGGATKLSMFYMLFPVFTALLIGAFKGNWPDVRTILAWGFAAVAIYLISTSQPQTSNAEQGPDHQHVEKEK
jgi:drug/metabolite transporter (DMT)-like permease